ncbi:MAG: hypothetical protein V1934_08560 [Methanobacteriota archaeon]
MVRLNVDAKLADYMKPLFGEMAERTVQLHKERLGLRGELSRDNYISIVKSISSLCRTMAGEAMARRMEEGLTRIVEQAG